MAPDVDEKILLKEFGRFGAIGSVKVMWPRDEEQRRKGRNVGFVAFMVSRAAQHAPAALVAGGVVDRRRGCAPASGSACSGGQC